MARCTWIARLFTAAVAAMAVTGTATAGIIPASVTVTPDSGNFRWTYSVVLPTNMMLQSGNYFTIYDVAGLVPGTISGPSGWVAATAFNTPAPAGLNPHDNGMSPDVTFTYSGPTIPSGQVGLGNFMFDSTYSNTGTGDFTAENPQVSSGNIDRNIVSTLVPAAPNNGPPGVPEPATLLLAGIGFPLVGAARMLRKKK